MWKNKKAKKGRRAKRRRDQKEEKTTLLNYFPASVNVTSNVHNIPTKKEEKKADARLFETPKNSRRKECSCPATSQKEKAISAVKRMLPRAMRLPLSSEEERAKRFDFSLESGFLKVRFRKNALKHIRYAIVISKKIVALATQRNRIKRILGNSVEKSIDKKKGYDISIWLKRAPEKPLKKNLPLLVLEAEALIKKIGN